MLPLGINSHVPQVGKGNEDQFPANDVAAADVLHNHPNHYINLEQGLIVDCWWSNAITAIFAICAERTE